MNAKQLLLSALLASGAASASLAQPLSTCDDLGVKNGEFGTTWFGVTGQWNDKNKQPVIETIIPGIDPKSHWIWQKPGVYLSEPNPNKPPHKAISVLPPGGTTAIQIGNFQTKRHYERLKTSFMVGQDNTLIQVKFAVVLEDQGHPAYKQPRFEFKAYDPSGSPLTCGEYVVIAEGNISGFENQGKIRFRDWTTASLDLRKYVGQVVTIEFSTFDCSDGGHFGMALFAIECLKAEITTANPYCPGRDSTITLAAPPGFANYQWSTGQSGETVTIANPKIGEKYTVKFQPFSSLSTDCTLELDYTVPNKIEVVASDTVRYCAGGEVVASASAPSGSTYAWSSGQSTSSITVSQPGDYRVTVTYEGCPFPDTISVVEIPKPTVIVTTDPVTCHGNTDGSAQAKLVLPSKNIQYAWSNGETKPFLKNLGAGAYTLTVTESVANCTTTAAATLTEPLPLLVKIKVVRTPACDNEPLGILQGDVTGGTSPYALAWSNGQQGLTVTIEKGGVFTATVTDANGCTTVSSLEVKELSVTESHADNYCYKAKQGWIKLSASDGIPPYQARLAPDSFQSIFAFNSLPSGTYAAEVQDATGCIQIREIEVVEHRTEPFRVVLPAAQVLNLGDLIEIKPVSNFPNYEGKWLAPGVLDYCDDCLELIGRAKQSGPIQLYATDFYGCPDTTEMYLEVNKERFFYAPNTFCPDASAVENQYWRIYIHDNQIARIVSLGIYDRWGGQWFGATNVLPEDINNARWDGKKKWGGKTAPLGVYVWVAEVEYIDNEIVRYSGDVTLQMCSDR